MERDFVINYAHIQLFEIQDKEMRDGFRKQRPEKPTTWLHYKRNPQS